MWLPPIARGIASRIVGGESLEDALATASELTDAGFSVGLELAAPPSRTRDGGPAAVADHLLLIQAVVGAGLGRSCEISILPEVFGVADDVITEEALTHLDDVCDHAIAEGVAVMIGMGSDVARTIGWVEARIATGASLGVTLQAARRRTETDCARLAGQRIRLVKGALRDSAAGVYAQPVETDKAYVRCAKVLLAGAGDPSFATHDTRLVEIVEAVAARLGRQRGSFEYDFFLGRLEVERDRLAAAGDRVRVHVPYGPHRLERLMGGFAEQPTTISAAVRSLLPGW